LVDETIRDCAKERDGHMGDRWAMSTDGTIRVGSRVRVRDQDGDEDLSIVTPDEVDVRSGRISMECPLSKALLGHTAGEEVRVRAPGGVRAVTIMSVDWAS
jgi:transcription elongation GreA/GreB family factor